MSNVKILGLNNCDNLTDQIFISIKNSQYLNNLKELRIQSANVT